MENDHLKKINTATEVATKINALLIAKGRLNQTNQESDNFLPDINYEDFTKQYSCNVDISYMNLAAKKILTYEEIIKEIKEKYFVQFNFLNINNSQKSIDKSEISSSEFCLIKIISTNKDKLLSSIQKFNQIINYVNKQLTPKSASIVSLIKEPSNLLAKSYLNFLLNKPAIPQYPIGHYLQDKIFIGLDHANPSFQVKENIQGPNNSYLDHIRRQSNAIITVRGKGSGFLEPASGKEAWEPLHIHVMHNTKDGLELAKKLAQSLIETVQTKYTIYQQSLTSPLPFNNLQNFQNLTLPPGFPLHLANRMPINNCFNSFVLPQFPSYLNNFHSTMNPSNVPNLSQSRTNPSTSNALTYPLYIPPLSLAQNNQVICDENIKERYSPTKCSTLSDSEDNDFEQMPSNKDQAIILGPNNTIKKIITKKNTDETQPKPLLNTMPYSSNKTISFSKTTDFEFKKPTIIPSLMKRKKITNNMKEEVISVPHCDEKKVKGALQNISGYDSDSSLSAEEYT